jgi:hypothetical protein
LKARVLHPAFFTDEKVRQLSPNGKLLLQGLWLRADDEGRGVYLPKSIEGDVFPTEQVDIYALLNEVIHLELIRPYEVGGQIYYDVPNWDRWQKPRYKAQSKLPEYPGLNLAETGQSVDRDSQEQSNGSVLGLEFKKGLEDVSQRDPGSLRQFWRRQSQEQRREGG